MNIFFWKKKIEEENKEISKVGSFLFCTDINDLQILSIERKDNYYTEMVFRNSKGEFVNNTYHKFFITHEQHEEFIEKISKDIKCVVVPGI